MALKPVQQPTHWLTPITVETQQYATNLFQGLPDAHKSCLPIFSKCVFGRAYHSYFESGITDTVNYGFPLTLAADSSKHWTSVSRHRHCTIGIHEDVRISSLLEVWTLDAIARSKRHWCPLDSRNQQVATQVAARTGSLSAKLWPSLSVMDDARFSHMQTAPGVPT